MVNNSVYEALEELLTGAGVLKLFQAETMFSGSPDDDTNMPYLVMQPVSENITLRTNTSRYRNVMLTFTVAHRTFRMARDMMDLVENALDEQPLNLTGELNLWLAAGQRTHAEESKFWRVNQDFKIMTSRKRPGR